MLSVTTLPSTVILYLWVMLMCNGRTGFVWVRHVWNGSTNPKSHQMRGTQWERMDRLSWLLRAKVCMHVRVHVYLRMQCQTGNGHLVCVQCRTGNGRLVRILVVPFQKYLTQAKPVLPLPNENSPQIKDQGWWQCCHTKHKTFPYRPTCDAPLISGHGGILLAMLNQYCCIGAKRGSDCPNK
jgi:hypothetical protein